MHGRDKKNEQKQEKEDEEEERKERRIEIYRESEGGRREKSDKKNAKLERHNH